MLRITIPATPPAELWDEKTETFISVGGFKGQTLLLEHSLVSLSKWESKWCKPFLTNKDPTVEETIDYIRCMTITQNVNPEAYSNLTDENIQEVINYINAPMTATTFREDATSKPNREIITAEIIYHWMISAQIPLEWEKRHLNRLLTLIRVCNIKNSPPKKRSKRDIASEYAALNAARRKQFNSNG